MSKRNRTPTQKKRPWVKMRPADFDPEKRDAAKRIVDRMVADGKVTAEEAEDAMRPPDEIWGNDLYTATVSYVDGYMGFVPTDDSPRTPWQGVLQISYHRHNRKPVRDWRHGQRIKNDIAGPEREAVELYPAESRLLDGANEYHLWVAPEGAVFPFGVWKRSVADLEEEGYTGTGARQRPIEDLTEGV